MFIYKNLVWTSVKLYLQNNSVLVIFLKQLHPKSSVCTLSNGMKFINCHCMLHVPSCYLMGVTFFKLSFTEGKRVVNQQVSKSFKKKLKHRALKLIYKDHVSSYDDLMSKAHVSTMLKRRLHGILCEVFKCIKGINSKCLNDLFEVKSTSYSLRNDFRLIQPKRRTTNSGLRTVSYLGAKLWNDNLALFVDTIDGDFYTFKSSLKI